ncbi:MAG TPA: hypothetical protein VNO21_22745 [Polyangiaceae bacterium]|nr:hypothetical protein [Polyangiaceae bacterium]
MKRATLQKAVFWALSGDFALLYLGAVRLDQPILTAVSLVTLGATIVAALFAF